MTQSDRDQLRDLLLQRVEAASKEAVRSGGQVPAEEVEALGRLARLVDLNEAVRQPPARRRWPVVLALGVTLMLVSLLLFVRVAETEIELDMALSEVSFILPTQQALTDAMNLTALGGSGLREIQLPRSRDQDARTFASSDAAEYALQLSVVSDGKHQGAVTLAPLLLPMKTNVWLRHTGVPHQYRVSLTGPSAEFRADVIGPVRIGLSEGGSGRFDFDGPDVAVLQSGENEVDLDLTLLDPTKSNFASQLSASDLSFFHVDEIRNPDTTVARRVSTILSGSLSYESLNGLERKLRPGEVIQFEDSHGEIRSLSLRDDRIDMKFHGRVRGMNGGSGESRRSLMPTWLELLQARHSLSLLWGTALYLFTLMASALRWWRKPL